MVGLVSMSAMRMITVVAFTAFLFFWNSSSPS